MDNLFARDMKKLQQEILDLKSFSKASSVLKASVYRYPIDFSGDQSLRQMFRFRVDYADGKNDILSEFYAPYRLITPETPVGNSQYIWVAIGQVAQDTLTIISTRPIVGVTRIT